MFYIPVKYLSFYFIVWDLKIFENLSPIIEVTLSYWDFS